MLTEEEFNSLAPESELHLAKEAIAELRKRLIGDKCIHSPIRDVRGFSYCDECPLSDLQLDKEDEECPSESLSEAMCDLDRYYSQ